MKEKTNEEILEDIKRLNLVQENRRRPVGIIARERRSAGKSLKNPTEPGNPSVSPGGPHQDTSREARRIEDTLPTVPPKLQKKIISYSLLNGFSAFGFPEWFRAVISPFFFRETRQSDIKISRKLSERLVSEDGLKNGSPRTYSLLDTVQELGWMARMLLGEAAPDFRERIRLDLVRETDGFAEAFLGKFRDPDPMMTADLLFLRKKFHSGVKIGVSSLAWSVKGLYKLVLATEMVPEDRIRQLVSDAVSIAKQYALQDETLSKKQREETITFLDMSEMVFMRLIENLAEFRRELYPPLLFMISSPFSWEDSSQEKIDRILKFAGVRKDEILVESEYRRKRKKEEEGKLKARQLEQIRRLEQEEQEQFGEQFNGILKTFAILFPESEAGKLEHAFLLPWFTDFFSQDLPFPAGIEQISREDPFRTILVLHRLCYELLTALDGQVLENILSKSDIRSTIAELRERWIKADQELLVPYIAEIAAAAKYFTDPDDRRIFREKFEFPVTRKLDEMRKHMINGLHCPTDRMVQEIYRQTGVVKKYFQGSKLYTLAAELSGFTENICEDLNSSVLHGKNTIYADLLRRMRKESIVDFSAHQNPGSVEYKPFVRQIRRYGEAKYKKPLTQIFPEAQVLYMEIFRETANLYTWLLNDPESFFRRPAPGLLIAGKEEKALWERHREKGAGNYRVSIPDNPDTYKDRLTGVFNRLKIDTISREAFRKLRESKSPLCFAMADIDHFKVFNDTWGHRTGDTVLRETARCMNHELHEGDDMGRYGGEEFFLVFRRGLPEALAAAERIRLAVERLRVSSEDASGQESRDEELSVSISIGVADCSVLSEYEQAVEYADKALYSAKNNGRNRVHFLERPGTSESNPRFIGYREHAEMLKSDDGEKKE